MKTVQTSTKLWAIVPAAGSGSRFSKTDLKQYQTINDVTVLQHSVERLFALPLQGCVLAVNAQDTVIQTIPFKQKEKIHLCEGGQERVHSVLNALTYLLQIAHPNDYVLVHDAARPCVGIEQLNDLYNTAITQSISAILATPVRDTLKQVLDVPNITKTVDRTALWQAQTPQIAPIGLLKTAIEQALKFDIAITDEASALEYAQHPVRVVAGRADNIKITYPEDLVLARLILQAQGY